MNKTICLFRKKIISCYFTQEKQEYFFKENAKKYKMFAVFFPFEI